MACILALDTSSEACSAALIKEGKVTRVYEVVPKGHTGSIIPMVKQVLQQSGTEPGQLDAIAFGRGPGSFTGLRIAAGVTQGLAYGLDIKVIPVSTLEAMALEASMVGGHSRIATAIDARMDEVYWGAFEVNGTQVITLQAETVCKPELVQLPESTESGDAGLADTTGFVGVGSGWQFEGRMPDAVQRNVTITDSSLLAKAEYIARLAESKYAAGEMVSAEQAIPVYLRDSVAWKKLPGR